jgi:hypothetical protein
MWYPEQKYWTDYQDYVSGLTSNYHPKWNGTKFVNGTIQDDGTYYRLGTGRIIRTVDNDQLWIKGGLDNDLGAGLFLNGAASGVEGDFKFRSLGNDVLTYDASASLFNWLGTLAGAATTDATSPTSAPLKTAGGLGVAKAAWIGDLLNVASTITGQSSIKSIGATAGIGYGTGAGGTVTQSTSKSTGVTLSKVCGKITMDAAALAADTAVSFTLTNTAIAATDILVMNHVSGGTAGAYTLNAQCGAGSAVITVRNVTAGSLSEAIVIGFVLVKGVTS